MSTTRAARISTVLASAFVLVVCLTVWPSAAQQAPPAGTPSTTRARAQVPARSAQVPTVDMPNLVGLPYQAALQNPLVVKFRIALTPRETASARTAGTIVGQEPAAGSPIRAGASAVVLVAVTPPSRGRATRPDVEIVRPDLTQIPPRRPTEPALGKMPNLVGQAFDVAVRRPDVRELRLRLEPQLDSAAPGLPGTVLKQSVPPGAGVEIGRNVSVVVATGVEVPLVMRQPSAVAERQIAAVGLRPASSTVLSDREPGTVVTQTPAAGVRVPRGGAVAITVARPRPRQPDDVVAPPATPPVTPVTPDPVLIRMPDLVGRSFDLAVQHPEVLGARLRLEQQFDPTAAGLPGTIVRQSVPAGTGVEVGRSVAVLVSTGVAVPLVMKQASGVAERQIAAAGLRPAVSNETSDAEPGTVIAQVPAAGVVVSRGASVAITVAVAEKVTVPDVIGRTRVEADQALTRLKLRVVAEDDALSTSEPGRVATQLPASGADAVAGATVRVGVAIGVTVPRLAGLSTEDAQRAVSQRGLSFEDTDVVSEQVPVGHVLTQQPAAGQTVARGSGVRVAIAVAPSVTVPNVVGLARAAAERTIRESRLTAEVSDDAASTGAPDSVVTQSPVAGTALRVGAAVRVRVATGVVVPAMIGQARDRAVALAAAAGLVVSIQSAADQAGAAGVVSGQEPQADTRVARGTAITLFLPLPASRLIAVPNVVGLARVQAEAALTRLGLGARVTEADNAAQANTVVSQSPEPNVQVALGSQIALVVARQAPTPTPVDPTPPSSTPPVVPVWLTPLLVVVALVGWQAWKFVRSDSAPARPPAEIHAVTPQIDLEPQAGEHSLRLEVFGKSLVDLEVRVRATHDHGEQSLQVLEETLIGDERRVYE